MKFTYFIDQIQINIIIWIIKLQFHVTKLIGVVTNVEMNVRLFFNLETSNWQSIRMLSKFYK